MKLKSKKVFKISLLSIFIFLIGIVGVQAKDIGFYMTPYNVTNACDFTTPYDDDSEESHGDTCFKKLLKDLPGEDGESMSRTKLISNNVVEKDQIIMVVINARAAESMDLQYFRLKIAYDTDKLSKIDLDPNDDWGTEIGMLDDALLKSTFPKKSGKTTWSTSLNPDKNGYFIAIADSGNDHKPYNSDKPIFAMFFKVKDTVTPGTKITLDYSFTSPDVTTLSNQALAELRTKADYDKLTLSVLSSTSTDGTLSALSATGNNSIDYLDGKFVPSDDEYLNYSIIVPYSVNSITFAGTPTDSNAKGTTNLGVANSLNVGNNELTVSVTAESSDVTNYKINVYRLNNDATIASITNTNSINFGTITDGTYEYSVTVPYKTTSTNATITLNDSENATFDNSTGFTSGGNWNITTDNSTDKLNTYKVKVKAENCSYTTEDVPDNVCTTQEYTFKITRTAPSKNVKLSSLTVDGVSVPDFSKTTYEYTLDAVNNSKTSVVVAATLDDELNSITSGTGTVNLSTIGNNQLVVTVTSEDGVTKQDYKINIYRKSKENTLQTLTLNSNPVASLSPSFQSSFAGDYTYEYDPNVTSISIEGVVKDTGKAKVSIIDMTTAGSETVLVGPQLNTASKTVGISVTKIGVKVDPEDSTEPSKTYTVLLKRKQSTNNYLSSLSISPGTITQLSSEDGFSPSVGAYKATVDADVTGVTVTAVLADPDNATGPVITGNTGFGFGAGNVISIAVTSEKGDVNTYTITVTRKEYDIATLSEIKVGFDSASPTEISTYTPTINNHTENEDGKDVDYTEYTLYTSTDPLSIDTSTINIECTKTNEYAEISNDSDLGVKNVNRGDNTYTISVTSQDGSKKHVYKIHVYKQKSSDNSTTGVSVAGVAAHTKEGEDQRIYYVTLENSVETIVPSQVVISVADGATVVKDTTSLTLSTTADNVFYYTVTSESGVAENYEIHITRKKSTSVVINPLKLRVDGEETATRSCNFDEGKYTCTISVPLGTTGYYLEPTLPTGATVSPVSSTHYTMNVNDPNDSEQTRTITITAEDTSVSQEYTVKVERAKSANADLKSITLTDVTGGKTVNIPINNFSSSKTLYNVTVSGDVEDVKVEAELDDEKGTIVTTLPHIMTLSFNQINQFVITVKAENGTTSKPYTLNITRQAKIDATLKDLKVSTNTDTATTISGFNGGMTNPAISNVTYGEATFNIVAHVNDDASDETDENAVIQSIIVNGVEQTFTSAEEVSKSVTLKTGANKIEIVVAAQNRGTTKTYTLEFSRALNSDTGIKGIKVAGVDATVDASDDHLYRVTVPNSVTKADQNNVVVTPNDGAVSSDALADYIVTTFDPLKTLDTNGDPVENEVMITVTAEDSTTASYKVLVTRTPSAVSKMNSVNIYSDVTPDIPRQCIFTDDVKTCTVDVDVSTTEINITQVLADNTATVTYSDGTNTTLPLPYGSSEGTKTVTIRVTAENKTDYTDYTVTINRAESSNSYIKVIKTNANQSDPTVLETIEDYEIIQPNYSITVPGTTKTIKIYAESYDVNTNIEGDDITTPANTVTFERTLNYGENTIVITGVAQNGTTRSPYTIKVTREKNTERRLKGIKINGQSIDNYMTGTTFDPDVKEYDIDIFDYNTHTISVTADPMDEKDDENDEGFGTVENTGLKQIQTIYYDNHDASDEYVNVIVLKSIAHNGEYYEYTLNVKRKASDKTNVAKVEVMYNGTAHQATYDSNKDMYILSTPVPNSFDEANDTNVIVTPAAGQLSTDNLATVTMTPTALVTDDPVKENVNIHQFTVTSEDGSKSKVYNLQITRSKSSESRLNDIKIVSQDDDELVIGTLDPVFNSDRNEYTVIIGQDIDKIRIKYDKKEKHETVTNAGDHDIDSSEMSITITSISEDGTSSTSYKLNISRVKNINNATASITATGDDGVEYEVTPPIEDDKPIPTRYYVTVPGSVTKVTLNVTAANSLATVAYVGPDEGTTSTYTLPVGTKTVQFNITSESQTTQRYYVEIRRQEKTDATLKNLSYQLFKGNVSSDLGMIDLTTPDEEPNKWVIPTLDNEYTRILFNAQLNDEDADLSGSIGMQSIAVGPNTYKIIVTAQDGTTKNEYIITTERNASSDATLKLLDARGYTLSPAFDSAIDTYNLTVSEIHEKFSRSDLTYITNHPQATVECDPEVTLSSTSVTQFKLVVTAEDRVTTKTYKLNITRPKSTDNTLKKVNLINGSLSPTFTPTGNEYTISVPYGATSFTIEGVKNVESQTVVGNDTYNLDDLTDNQVIISVHAEDPSISVNNYIFHIVRAQSNDGSLSNLYVAGYPFQPTGTSFSATNYTYTIGDIDRSIAQINVYATPNNVDAKVEYIYDTTISECTNQSSCLINLTPGIGPKSVTVKVTPADESTMNIREYVITYNKVASSNANLASLTSSDGSFDKAFNVGTLNYILTVPNSVDSVDLTMVTQNPYANITAGGSTSTNTKTVTISDLPEGEDKVVTILITPETGALDSKTYTVTIRRSSAEASDDNFLASLSVTDHSFKSPNENFNATTTSYSIGQIPYNLTELTINAIANDPKAVISYYVDGEQQSSNIVTIPKNPNSTITVKVIAENGEPKDYTITLSKNPSSDATLRNLVVSKGTLDPVFDKDSTVRNYEVTVPHSDTSIDITAILNDAYAVATFNGKTYVSGTATTVNNLQVGRNTCTFVVTAENGTTSQTYKITIIRENEDEMITSQIFGHTIEDGYIKTGILSHTGLDMKNELDNDNSKLEIWKADESAQIDDTDKIGTGMIVKLIVSGNEVDRKVIVVKGDTDGNGKVALLDAIYVLNHYLDDPPLTGPYLLAGDTDDNGKVALLDAINILNHYLDLSYITYIA